jgi:uncharacterized secreted protein with C-terminal beta-propeller domain
MKRFLILLGVITSSFLFAVSASAATCNTSALGKVVFGQNSVAVANIQACLISAGYSLPAGATGYYGAQTRVAVKAFYKAELSIANWDGNSVGVLGRKALAAKAKGGAGPSLGNVLKSGYKHIASADELTKYLDNAVSVGIGFGGGVRTMGMGVSTDGIAVAVPSVAPSATVSQGASNMAKSAEMSSDSSRYSETNVQVAGIDEPDYVKTDGKNLYISRQQNYYYRGGGGVVPMMDTVGVSSDTRMMPSIMPSIDYPTPHTLVVRAFPLSSLGIESDAINETGELLYSKTDKILMVLNGQKIVAYDVSNPKLPVKKWTNELDANAGIVTSRLTNGTLYLVTNLWVNRATPCPYTPILKGPGVINIRCSDIWIPQAPEPVNSSYTIMAIDPAMGKVTKKLSLAGDSSNTVVSVFANNMYLTYRSQSTSEEVTLDFIETQLTDYLSAGAIAKIKKIRGYDISNQSKANELQKILEVETSGMNKDKQLKFQNDMQNRMSDYLNARMRDMDRSVVVRIPLDMLTIAATASIPGHLLNQFSLDENNGYLRLAVSVGEQWTNGGNTKNDVYVLNQDLSIAGSILNLGLTERIYSARFVGNRGYLVTFRQIDPFYVLDLASPANPKLAGELKIPGYSAYLEPIDENTILGVGQDGSKVKLALFNVADPKNPKEKSKYALTEGWTEVNSNHHAFLKDDTHKIFFIPGGSGGYVFGYEGGTLSLKTAVSGYAVKRAVYISDYLYIVGDDKITVLNENTWEKEKELDLK